MEANNGPGTLVTREQQEFMRWRAQREVLGKVKRLSKWFALAFFLEMILMYVAQDLAYAFWSAVEMTGLFDSAAMWAIADETFAAVYYLLVFLPPYLIYAKLAKFRLREIPRQRLYAPVALAGTGVSMGISLVGSYVTMIALNFFSLLGLNPPDLPGPPVETVTLLFYIFNTVILAPVIEEFVYRGVLLGSLRRFGDGAAIVISALLFGLAHGNMAQLPYSFILGMTMAYFVIKTNSIYTSIFIHFVNNALATFMELFLERVSEPVAYMAGSLETLLDAAVFVLAMIYLIGIRRADWKIYPSGSGTPVSAVARQFFVTLPMILALLVMGYHILTSFVIA